MELMICCQGEILSFYCRHRHKANVTSSDQFLVDSLPVRLNNVRLVFVSAAVVMCLIFYIDWGFKISRKWVSVSRACVCVGQQYDKYKN